MTLDEAIEERLKVIKVQEKLYEESYSDESKEIIKNATDNDRQLAEWLKELKELREIIDACNTLAVDAFAVVRLCKELKEAKRLLKAAINDIYKECTCNTWGCNICEHLRKTCDYDDRFTWRHKTEVMKLIEEEEK